jgi:hypothetical protein
MEGPRAGRTFASALAERPQEPTNMAAHPARDPDTQPTAVTWMLARIIGPEA